MDEKNKLMYKNNNYNKKSSDIEFYKIPTEILKIYIYILKG